MSSDWNQQTLNYTYLFPNAQSNYRSATLQANGSSINPESFFTVSAVPAGYSSEQVNIYFFSSVEWYSASFNGFELSGPSTDAPIKDIYVAYATAGGFSLSYTANGVFMNWQGASFSAGTVIDIRVDFASVTYTSFGAPTVEAAQQTVIGSVAPSSPGDSLSITQAAGSAGTVSLGATLADGTRQVVYTAPASVSSARSDTVGFTVSDLTAGVSTAGSAQVQLDPGPSLVPVTSTLTDLQGQSVVIGTVTAGLSADTLTVQQASGSVGTVSLGAAANGVQQVIYTAPASVAASGTDTVSYTVKDQHNDAAASATSTIHLQSALSVVSVSAAPGTGDLDPGKNVTITVVFSEAAYVQGAPPALSLDNGATAIFSGGSGSNTLSFTYMVAPTDAGVTVLAVTGLIGSIQDAAGANADLSALATTFGQLQIDTTPPAVITAVASPSTGAEGIGDTLTLTLGFSEAVVVAGGTPTLTLNDGGTATYTGGSGTAKLTYSYTVAAGDPGVASLAITAAALNGATIQDAAGNDADLTGAVATLGPQIDTTPPAVTSVTGTSNDGSVLDAGHVITIAVDTTKTVYVTGTPALMLSDGTLASYTGGSGTGSLTFKHTTQAGENTVDLTVTGLSLSAGSIKDTAGNALVGSVASDLGLIIDTTAPTVLSVAGSAASTFLNAGQEITVSVVASEPVFVDTSAGTPFLLLSDGERAAYESGSGTSTLTFSNAVANGDAASDLRVTGLTLGGGKIADAAGNALAGAVTADLGLVVDTTTPAILYVTAGTDTGSADVDAGHGVTITVTATRPVVVDTTGGTPRLLLNDGAVATYSGGSGSTTLSFAYTVGATDTAANLAVTSLDLNGGTIRSPAGTALTGSAASGLGITVDTTAPAIGSVTAQTKMGATNLDAGQVITLTLAVSEPVLVDTSGGSPVLTLSDGRTAAFTGGSGSAALVFTAVVQPGDNAANLTVTGLALQGATIHDGAGNALTGTATADLGLKVDTTAPTLSVVAASASGAQDLDAGQVVTVTLNADKTLVVDTSGGTPYLSLGDGARASYTGGSGTAALTFRYTVGAGDNTTDLTVTGLVGNGGSVTDLAGNQLPPLTADLALQVDTTAPLVTSLLATADSAATVLDAGHAITITLTTSEPVYISTAGGTPVLTLSDGGTASYVGGSGSTALVFTTTVQAGQTDPSLHVTGLQQNGAGLRDGAGNPLASVAGDLGLCVDTTAPSALTLSAVSDGTAATVSAGHTITVTLATSEPVFVGTGAGTPVLTLSDGEVAAYTGGSGTAALTFSTLVKPGDGAADLRVTALTLNGGTVTDAAGNAITAVSGDLGLVVDTTVPTVAAISVSPKPTVLPGQTVAITLALTDPVTVTGGTPSLLLSNGGVAVYDATATAAAGDPAKLVFDYGVSLATASSDILSVTGVTLDGASVANAAGTAAVLSGAIHSLGIAVDTTLYWATTAPGDWDTAADWSAGVVPGSGNGAVIGGTASERVGISGAADTAQSLTVSDPNAIIYLSGTLALTNGLTLDGLLLTGSTIDGGEASAATEITTTTGLTIASGAELIGRGTTTIVGDVVDDSTGISGYGGLSAQGGLHVTGSLSGSGTAAIGGALKLGGAVTVPLAFDDAGYGGARLTLDQPTLVTGPISGVTAGEPFGSATGLAGAPFPDVIDLAGIQGATVSYAGDILTVSQADGTQFALTVTGGSAGSLQDAALTSSDDGRGGTAISWQVGLTDTWIATGGGDWSNPANWSLGFAPGRFDTAVLGGGGTITVGPAAEQAYALTIDPSTTLDVAGRLSLGTTPDLGGATVAISGSGELSLANGGTLDDGTVTLADGSIVVPLALTGAMTSAPGALVLGPALSVVQQGGTTGNAVITAGSVTNEGSIDASVQGGELGIAIEAATNGPLTYATGGFVNAGSLHVGNGDQFVVSGAVSSDNAASGTIEVDGGASATLGGDTWSNEGAIGVGAGSTLVLQGNFAPASLAGITNDGTVELDGIASQSGEILVAGGRWIIDPSFALPTSVAGTTGTAGQSFTGATLEIATGTTLELRGVPAVVQQGSPGTGGYVVDPGEMTSGVVTFDGPATLQLAQPGDFSGTLAGLGIGDTIDFAGAAITQASFDANSLSIGFDGQTYDYAVQYGAQGALTPDQVTLASDGNGGTDLLLHADTTPPAITAIAAASDTGGTDLDAGRTVTITVDLREAVTVTGTPALTLNDGASASYAGGDGTSELTFTTVIQPGQITPDLTVLGLDLSQGSITDPSGNGLPTNLPAGLDGSLGLQVDTTAPRIVAVTTNPAEGVLHPGQTVALTLTFSEPVLLSGGQPGIVLSNGGTALYDSVATAALDNPAQLVFRETIQPTDASAASPTVASFPANGASLVDGAGNPADVTAAIGQALGFGVDTAAAVATGTQSAFFIATSPDTGQQQVYASDGTAAGTVLLAPSGTTYTSPANLTATALGTLFTASSTTTETVTDMFGNESTATIPESLLLRSDSTAGGTTVVATLQGGVDGNGNPDFSQQFTTIGSLGGTILVAATASYYGSVSGPPTQTLYASDGTSLDTLVSWSGYAATGELASFATAGSLSYFVAPLSGYPSNGGPTPLGLWQTDGTANGTAALGLVDANGPVDLYDQNTTPPAITGLTPAGSTLYFLGDGTLYSTQGGTGTQLVSDTQAPYEVTAMTAAGSDLYFVDAGGGLFYTDGSTANTTELQPEGSFLGAQSVVLAGNRLFLIADAPGTATPVVWTTTGSAGSPVMLPPADGSEGVPSSLTALGGQAFYVADDATGASRLWHTDGTLAGTTVVSPAGDTLIAPADLAANGDRLVFQAYDAVHGTELWQTDGTAAGTTLVADLIPGGQSDGYAAGSPVTVGNLAFFKGFDPVTNSQVLYRTDGTAAGTQIVAPATGGYVGVSGFAVSGSKVYFTATGPNGNVLWQTDGTAAGTVELGGVGDLQVTAATSGAVFLTDLAQLAAVTPGSATPVVLDAQAYAGSYVQAGQTLYYESNGEVWQSDGTPDGTGAIAGTNGALGLVAMGSDVYFLAGQYGTATTLGHVHAGAASTLALPSAAQGGYNLVAAGSSLYFENGQGLWHVSGSTVAPVAAGDGSTLQPNGALTSAGNDVFFANYIAASGQNQLWQTDGTAAGTKAVELPSGPVTDYEIIGTQGGAFYFQTTDAAGHATLWKADGTQTVQVLSGGFTGFDETGLGSVGGKLLVSASTGDGNGQLYATDGTSGGTAQLTSIDAPNSSYPSDIVVASAAAAPSASGLAIDGYVVGGTVFADANGNGQWDPGEAETTTGSGGAFSLTGGSGPLVLEGGTDATTNLDFTGHLAAPAGSVVITPLTTVVQALTTGSSALSVAGAEQAVATAFGLTLPSGTDVDSYDPIAGLFAGDSGAATELAAAAQVQDTVALAAAALGGLDPTLSGSAAATDVVLAIAQAAQAGTPLDLSATGYRRRHPGRRRPAGRRTAAPQRVDLRDARNHHRGQQQPRPGQRQRVHAGCRVPAGGGDRAARARCGGDRAAGARQPERQRRQLHGSRAEPVGGIRRDRRHALLLPRHHDPDPERGAPRGGTGDRRRGRDRVGRGAPGPLDRAAELCRPVRGRGSARCSRSVSAPARWATASRPAISGSRRFMPCCSACSGRAACWSRPENWSTGRRSFRRTWIGSTTCTSSWTRTTSYAPTAHLAETYLDDGNRTMFHNVADYVRRHGDAEREAPSYCAPRLESGDRVEATWQT